MGPRATQEVRSPSLIMASDIYFWLLICAWIFENRVSKDKDSFYYLAIKNNKIRPKADKKAYIWRRAISLYP